MEPSLLNSQSSSTVALSLGWYSIKRQEKREKKEKIKSYSLKLEDRGIAYKFIWIVYNGEMGTRNKPKNHDLRF